MVGRHLHQKLWRALSRPEDGRALEINMWGYEIQAASAIVTAVRPSASATGVTVAPRPSQICNGPTCRVRAR